MPDETEYSHNLEDTVKDADAVVLMTEWDEYKNMDLKKINHCMKGKLFVDLRNIFDPQEMEEIGFEYHSVGR